MNFLKASLIFTISSIASLSTLVNPVFAGTLVPFSSGIRYGNAGANERLELSTASARDVSLLSRDLNFKLPLGTEGSAIKFTNLTQGNSYLFDWTFASQETRGEDIFYLFDGKKLSTLGTSRMATTNIGGGWRTAPKVITTEFRVQSSNVMLILMDTRDKSFTSIVKVTKLRKIPESNAVLGIISAVVIGMSCVKKANRS
ncbi:MAG: hypothetical protein KME29_14035 [Calothrix sp. FI2-JRJ7]|jgi:hypothetical protein|nr:hypothetical protein [Calothrix sp. FI2-JRJ7]